MDLSTPTADLMAVKLLLNSVISTPGARFVTLDIKFFNLNSPMEEPGFQHMKIEYLPQDFIGHYNLKDTVDAKGNLYTRVKKGMYGLPQAGKMANKQRKHSKNGYTQSPIAPGFWKQKWRHISFTLIADNFGVKYVGEQHVNHLLTALRKCYVDNKNKKGDKYCGITID